MVSPAATVATAATTVVLHHYQGQDRDPRVNHPYLPFHTDFYSGFYKMSDKHWRLCQPSAATRCPSQVLMSIFLNRLVRRAGVSRYDNCMMRAASYISESLVSPPSACNRRWGAPSDLWRRFWQTVTNRLAWYLADSVSSAITSFVDLLLENVVGIRVERRIESFKTIKRRKKTVWKKMLRRPCFISAAGGEIK